MSILHNSNKRHTKFGVEGPKNISFPRVTLASAESLTIPLVQEVVLVADFKCKRCQERVADIFSRMKREPEMVLYSVLEKKVTLTCRHPPSVEIPSQKLPKLKDIL